LKKFGIRTFFNIITILLGSIILISSVFFVIMSQRLYRRTTNMQETVESVDAANQITISLLIYHRYSFLSQIRANEQKELREKRETERTRLFSLLDKSKQYIESRSEKTLIDSLSTSITDYFAMGDQMETRKNPPREIFDQTSPLLDKVILLTDDLRNLKHDRAEALQKRSYMEDKTLRRIAIAIVIFVFALAVTLLFFIKGYIYTPIIKLCYAIRAFNASVFTKTTSIKGPKEIREIHYAFNDMGDMLLKQHDSQYRFLAAIAHDLRNPLNAIALSSDLLSKKDVNIDPEFKNMIGIINRQAKHLNRMVGDLLDMTRIQAGKLELKLNKIDIRDIIKDAVELYKSISPVHHLKLVVPSQAIYCMVDSVRIGQAINNFLSNAIKYSPSGGEVSVEIRQQGNEAVVAITDQGIGIKEDEHKQIFEPFMRTKETRDTIPGVGIGLSIAKHIIDAHKGRIEIRSKTGKGTTFIIYLPLIKF
jgi:two-component system, OmpR family, sensor histidine kinase MtrB